jgi:hypothetical protein
LQGPAIAGFFVSRKKVPLFGGTGFQLRAVMLVIEK